jgi:GNAT superfamily N-acetyltransferase
MYQISEVDGVIFADEIIRFNAMVEEWPKLQPRHFEAGYWWFAYLDDEPVAFAGLVPNEPFSNVGYLKRCYVCPDHHGHGLQYRLLLARELKAKQLGWTMLVSECGEMNRWSAANFLKCGFQRVDPEQPWTRTNDQYFAKMI